MYRLTLSGLAGLLLVVATVSSGESEVIYTYQTFSAPGDNVVTTTALGVNDAGQIVGNFGNGSIGLILAFLRTGGSFSVVDAPFGPQDTATDINNVGQIVGVSAGSPEAAGWLKTGDSYVTVNVSNPVPVRAFPSGVNDVGQIVGTATGADAVRHGFFKDGSTSFLFDPPGASQAQAQKINNGGIIVGFFLDVEGAAHGYIKNGDAYTVLDVPGAVSTSANGINDAGQIVGSFRDVDGVSHGFLKDGDSYMILDVPGHSFTGAADINNSGAIVGAFFDEGAGVGRGFLAVPSAVPSPGSLSLLLLAVLVGGILHATRKRAWGWAAARGPRSGASTQAPCPFRGAE